MSSLQEKKKKKLKGISQNKTQFGERASISIRGSRDAGIVRPEIQDNLTEAHTVTNKSRKKINGIIRHIFCASKFQT